MRVMTKIYDVFRIHTKNNPRRTIIHHRRVKQKSGVSYHFQHNQIQIKVKNLKHNYINNYAVMVVNANSLVTKKNKKLSYYYWHCTQHSYLECAPRMKFTTYVNVVDKVRIFTCILVSKL